SASWTGTSGFTYRWAATGCGTSSAPPQRRSSSSTSTSSRGKDERTSRTMNAEERHDQNQKFELNSRLSESCLFCVDRAAPFNSPIQHPRHFTPQQEV